MIEQSGVQAQSNQKCRKRSANFNNATKSLTTITNGLKRGPTSLPARTVIEKMSRISPAYINPVRVLCVPQGVNETKRKQNVILAEVYQTTKSKAHQKDLRKH